MRALLLFLLLVAAAAAEDEGAPGLAVAPLAPDPARDARIEELIGELPAVDRPWHGISDTSGGGVAFDAVEANLGIVPDAFRELLAHPATDGVPFILETPGSRDPGNADIPLLKRLRLEAAG